MPACCQSSAGAAASSCAQSITDGRPPSAGSYFLVYQMETDLGSTATGGAAIFYGLTISLYCSLLFSMASGSGWTALLMVSAVIYAQWRQMGSLLLTSVRFFMLRGDGRSFFHTFPSILM